MKNELSSNRNQTIRKTVRQPTMDRNGKKYGGDKFKPDNRVLSRSVFLCYLVMQVCPTNEQQTD